MRDIKLLLMLMAVPIFLPGIYHGIMLLSGKDFTPINYIFSLACTLWGWQIASIRNK